MNHGGARVLTVPLEREVVIVLDLRVQSVQCLEVGTVRYG